MMSFLWALGWSWLGFGISYTLVTGRLWSASVAVGGAALTLFVHRARKEKR